MGGAGLLPLPPAGRHRAPVAALLGLALLLAAACGAPAPVPAPQPAPPAVAAAPGAVLQTEEAFLAELEERTFRWFWDLAHPENGFIAADWRGYNEAMIVVLLALGSPTHPVAPEAWEEWTSRYRWVEQDDQAHVAFAPLFGHQYSHVWVDFRGIQDAFMRRRGIDYFENSRRATLAQRAWAVANPRGWEGLGPDVWGVTACDGPVDLVLPFRGELRRFWTYAGRGAGADHPVDDGTLAPTAAGGSVPFAPEVAIPALMAMRERWGDHLWGRYGFFDAFNPSFDFAVPVQHGRVVPGVGWFDTDYLGIDQGPILAMIENHRSGLVWRVLRRDPHLRRGLRRAGFTGGWLAGEG
jgi:hypothetical protein